MCFRGKEKKVDQYHAEIPGGKSDEAGSYPEMSQKGENRGAYRLRALMKIRLTPVLPMKFSQSAARSLVL